MATPGLVLLALSLTTGGLALIVRRRRAGD
jgi:hypothetical protein